jgi:hypothetical protein
VSSKISPKKHEVYGTRYVVRREGKGEANYETNLVAFFFS